MVYVDRGVVSGRLGSCDMCVSRRSPSVGCVGGREGDLRVWGAGGLGVCVRSMAVLVE